MFRVALEPLSKPRPTDRNGPDLRTPVQRMGDGFHELLRRFLASGAAPSHGGEKPQIVITIDADKLRNGRGTATLLHTGATISAHTAQELACDSQISDYNPGTQDGAASLSDGVRLYTGKVRKLLELRDRGCAFPGCNRPPSWCQAHHIVPWSKGGPTTSTTVLSCAAITTATSTKEPGGSERRRTGSQTSSHSNGSTTAATHSATTASETDNAMNWSTP